MRVHAHCRVTCSAVWREAAAARAGLSSLEQQNRSNNRLTGLLCSQRAGACHAASNAPALCRICPAFSPGACWRGGRACGGQKRRRSVWRRRRAGAVLLRRAAAAAAARGCGCGRHAHGKNTTIVVSQIDLELPDIYADKTKPGGACLSPDINSSRRSSSRERLQAVQRRGEAAGEGGVSSSSTRRLCRNSAQAPDTTMAAAAPRAHDTNNGTNHPTTDQHAPRHGAVGCQQQRKTPGRAGVEGRQLRAACAPGPPGTCLCPGEGDAEDLGVPAECGVEERGGAEAGQGTASACARARLDNSGWSGSVDAPAAAPEGGGAGERARATSSPATMPRAFWPCSFFFVFSFVACGSGGGVGRKVGRGGQPAACASGNGILLLSHRRACGRAQHPHGERQERGSAEEAAPTRRKVNNRQAALPTSPAE